MTTANRPSQVVTGLRELADLAIDDVLAGKAPGSASVEARAARILMDIIGVSPRVAIDATRTAWNARQGGR